MSIDLHVTDFPLVRMQIAAPTFSLPPYESGHIWTNGKSPQDGFEERIILIGQFCCWTLFVKPAT